MNRRKLFSIFPLSLLPFGRANAVPAPIQSPKGINVSGIFLITGPDENGDSRHCFAVSLAFPGQNGCAGMMSGKFNPDDTEGKRTALMNFAKTLGEFLVAETQPDEMPHLFQTDDGTWCRAYRDEVDEVRDWLNDHIRKFRVNHPDYTLPNRDSSAVYRAKTFRDYDASRIRASKYTGFIDRSKSRIPKV